MNCHLKTRRKRSGDAEKENNRNETRSREFSSASNVMYDDVVQLSSADYEALKGYIG